VAVILGETELAAGTCVVRNLVSGEQRTVAQEALLSDYQQHL
jgi:histidyl-tRNA synthetase